MPCTYRIMCTLIIVVRNISNGNHVLIIAEVSNYGLIDIDSPRKIGGLHPPDNGSLDQILAMGSLLTAYFFWHVTLFNGEAYFWGVILSASFVTCMSFGLSTLKDGCLGMSGSHRQVITKWL